MSVSEIRFTSPAARETVPAAVPLEQDHPHQDGVVASGVYVHGVRVADIPVTEAGEWARKDDHVVWIGLLEPEPALLRCVQQQFNLHPLAVEDATNAHQRPKLEQYGDALFVVARTAQLAEGRIAFGERRVKQSAARHRKENAARRCAERRPSRESGPAYQDWPASVGAPSPLSCQSSGALRRESVGPWLFEI